MALEQNKLNEREWIIILHFNFLMLQVNTGAKQCHQLVFILADVPLHDFHTRAQQTLKSLDIYYYGDKIRNNRINIGTVYKIV